MAKWWWGPYWEAEHRGRRGEDGRVYQVDHRITEFRVTNPTAREGVLDLVFHEARGDGNFYQSDWAGGSWSAPPRWQRFYRPDPSRVFGSRFFLYGWFTAWTSLDEMLIDVRLRMITKSVDSGNESISQQTIQLLPRRAPIEFWIPEVLDRFRSGHRSHLYSPGVRPTDELMFTEPERPDEPGG